MHDHHPSLLGYDRRQILFDGCQECEARGKDVRKAIVHLDGDNFVRAWKRAADWERDVPIGRVSAAERGLLDVLFAIQVTLEQRGIPVGTVPGTAFVPDYTDEQLEEEALLTKQQVEDER